MNIKKVLVASVSWIIFPRVLIESAIFINLPESGMIVILNVINLFLGMATILSAILIIFGSIGYAWTNYIINKEKEKKFKEAVYYGIIIFIATVIIYGIFMPPIVPGLR